MRKIALLIQVVVMFSALVSLQAAFSSGSSNTSPFQVVTSYSSSQVPVSTVTWTSTVGLVLLSDSFTVPEVPSTYGCNYSSDNFTAPAGPISGTMTASSRVDFYLFSQAQYNMFLAYTGCEQIPPAIAGRTYMTSYNFTANLPQSGKYFLVFMNFSKTSTSNVVVTVNSVGSPVTYTTTSNSLYVQTVFSTYSSTASSATTPTTGSAIEIGIIAVIIAGAVLAYVYGKKRPPKEPQKRSETQSPTKPSKATLGKQFCGDCGNELPLGSKFCNKCGAEQRTL